jgi:GAF domain-containing protein
MATRHILCVDPDDDALDETVERLRADLSDLDPVFETAGTLAAARDALTTDTDAVVTEYHLPDGTGVDLVRTARETCPDAGCVLYTDADPDDIDTDELRGAITEYVGKDSVFGVERLARLLRTTVETGSQQSYPLPQNEAERLAALRTYDLDDPELVASLNRITDLAATHFGVERASVNIINEHSQDFLTCYGDTEEWESMDRQDSICTFTILEDGGVMTVEDVTEDPRFESRSDTLVEMGIRSYIGANLVTPAGLVVGPLCVYDDEPRSFTESEKGYLRNLADLAMDLIELYARLDGVEAGR